MLNKMEKVYKYIDEHREEYLALLQKFLRQPSISTANVGMREMATLVESTLESMGFSVEEIPTDGYPIVYGELKGAGERTLTFYNHYDVQPVDPLNEWEVDPFGGTIQDGKIISRGTADNKGQMLSRLFAVDAYKKVYGQLPLNIKVVYEGEEEVGSPHLAEFPKLYPEKLATDGIVWEGGGRDTNGPAHITLGVKGLAYVELQVRTANIDAHSSNAPIWKNAAWRLVWALSTLKNENDEILIDGFYDDVAPLTQKDLDFLESIPYDEKAVLEKMEMDGFVNNVTGQALLKKLLYTPTCNICGMKGGYIDEGSKTVLPAYAMAKLDFRLVPNMTRERVVELLRKHLDKHGFMDVEIVSMPGQPAYRTDLENPLVKAAIAASAEVYQIPPAIYPTSSGTMGVYHFCHDTGIPCVMYGVANEFSQVHAPNENIYVEDFFLGIKMSASVIDRFSQADLNL